MLITKQLLVTAALISRENKILMAKRLPFGSEANKWEFPGGKVEPGEDPRHCLARELKEELGITAAIGEILEVVSEIKAETQIILLYFHCRISSGEPVPLQCQEFRWLDPQDINLLEKPGADTRFWETFDTVQGMS